MKTLIVFIGSCLFLLSPSSNAQIPQIPEIPQIPAFLPWSYEVPMSDKLPIDGEWMITAIRKRIRIEGGRAYAVDSWLHLFVLKIEPMMVVQQQWRRTGPREYAGEDLPLLGPFTATLNPNGNMTMQIQGALGPVTLQLVPIRVDSQQHFELEKAGKFKAQELEPDYENEESEDDYEEDYELEEGTNE